MMVTVVMVFILWKKINAANYKYSDRGEGIFFGMAQIFLR